MTVDALQEEILINSNENTLLILPESKRLTTSIRDRLEDIISASTFGILIEASSISPKANSALNPSLSSMENSTSKVNLSILPLTTSEIRV